MSSSSDDESLSSSDVEAKKPVARTPRNPLAEFRQQNASACRDLQPSMPASLGNGDALWSDSDDNGVPTPVASSEKKKGRGRPIVHGVNVLPKDSIEDIIEKNRKKKSRVDLDGVGKDRHQVRALVPKLRHVLEHEEEQLRLELMPDFVHPKFGPYELEPLQLVGLNSGGRHHQVPASISRYLKPYQKEGITFMYNKAIMLKRGVILGDGE